MTNDAVEKAYGSPSINVQQLLGTEVSATDPDRTVIEPWAATVQGSILDVGSGTGRWAGHLATLGYSIEGLEPVEKLIELARRTYPGIPFQRGSIDDLADIDRRWAGVLAWYSTIHLGPQQLPDALSILRGVLEEHGSLLISFFSGPALTPFNHPVSLAYLWPMDRMAKVLKEAGFEVIRQHTREPEAPHAYIIANVAIS